MKLLIEINNMLNNKQQNKYTACWNVLETSCFPLYKILLAFLHGLFKNYKRI